eukprot:3054159-Pleurochrysis_carterae.AAC.1
MFSLANRRLAHPRVFAELIFVSERAPLASDAEFLVVLGAVTLRPLSLPLLSPESEKPRNIA